MLGQRGLAGMTLHLSQLGGVCQGSCGSPLAQPLETLCCWARAGAAACVPQTHAECRIISPIPWKVISHL